MTMNNVPTYIKKNGSHLKNHPGQNNLVKPHTPYLKDCYMKDVINMPKQK